MLRLAPLIAAACALASVETVAASWPPPNFPPPAPPMTAFQKDMMASIEPLAAAASHNAEALFLEEFSSSAYRTEMRIYEEHRLAELAPEETLAELKQALASAEYLTNMGVYPVMKIAGSIPNTTTVDQWGFYPNRWERKLWNETGLGIPDNMWAMYDAQETSLYRLKSFAKPLEPTWEEAIERQSAYSSVNHLRLGAGIEQFGPYAMSYRGNVVRDRILMIAQDSGGWEIACNESLHNGPFDTFWKKWAIQRFYDCSAQGGSNYTKPGWHPPPARPGHDLHLLYNNVKAFHGMGASLPRLMWQMLSPSGQVNPLDTHFYTEAIVLGAVRPREDLRMMVVNFEMFFGSKEGDDLVEWCNRHALPLVWGLGFGTSKHEQGWHNTLPRPLGRPLITVGKDRVLDPRTVAFTNGTDLGQASPVWATVDAKVRAFRQKGQETEQAQVFKWWEELQGFAQGVVSNTWGACYNTDLCFGTQTSSGKCICRIDPAVDTVVLV